MSNSAERDTEMANGEAEEDSADEQELLLGGLEKLVIVRLTSISSAKHVGS